jgi:pyridoxal phosphate enzyme (YggS family)
MTIAQRLDLIRERIYHRCLQSQRDPKDIRIIAAAKGRFSDQIRQVVQWGIVDIAENRVQEAAVKVPLITSSGNLAQPVRWHMIGHLQTNKVKPAVGLFDCLQSVDSLRLAGLISAAAGQVGKVQDILLEVKTSSEATKYGILPDELADLFSRIRLFKHIRTLGLMTLAPVVQEPEAARPYFRQLRLLRDKLEQATEQQLPVLSMGMTDDFEVAIEEGATMIRLGRAIFG